MLQFVHRGILLNNHFITYYALKLIFILPIHLYGFSTGREQLTILNSSAYLTVTSVINFIRKVEVEGERKKN